MSDIKSLLGNKVVSPNIDANRYIQSTGIVLRAYEKDNVCDIQYLDAQCRIKTKDKVEVLVKRSNDDWFPQAGDRIEVQIYENYVYITGQIITDYNTEVKPRQKLEQDIYADGADSSVGCLIF